MKKLYRAMSILICFALLAAAVPAEHVLAFAEEAPGLQEFAAETPATQREEVSEATDASAGNPSTETESATPVETPAANDSMPEVTDEPLESTPETSDAAPTEGATGDTTPEPDPAEEGTEQVPEINSVDEQTEVEEIGGLPEIDYSKKADKNPAFVMGFAEIVANDTEVYAGNASSDECIAWIGKGVVYVISRTPEDSSKPDRLEIAFNADPEKSPEIGWVDAAAARPLDPAEGAELERYFDACKSDADVRYYANKKDCPLQPVQLKYPEPVTVSLSQTSATIGVGDKGVTLKVLFSDGKPVNADGTPREVKFSSSATKYATVDAKTGMLTGVRKGSATITVLTQFGKASCKVTVKSAPKTIGATPAKSEIFVGETVKITPKFARSSYGGSCTYQSSDPTIAEVAADGTVTGISKGQVTIYIYAYNLPKNPAKAMVTVYGPASDIAFSEETISLCTGMEQKLNVVLPEYEREAYTFASDDASVVSVSDDGVVHAHAQGSAVITATTVGTDHSASCTVQVLPSPEEEDVILTSGSYKLGLNESFNVLDLVRLTGGCHAQFSFKSSSSKYAKVDSTGKVTGLRAGSATITIATHNGIVRTVKVTVYKNPTSVSFSTKTLTLGVGMSAQTKVVFNPTTAYSQYNFISSNESVATVDPHTGVVTAHAEGTAVIGCIPIKGKTGACSVKVLPAPSEIGVSADELVIGLGETGRSIAGRYPADTMCSFTYTSEDTDVLTVDAASGAITTVGTGSTNIVVTSHNGVTASCRVHVMETPTSLTLNKTTMKLMVGETNDSLTGVVNEGAASGIKLSSSNTRYVKVSNGKLVGVKAGTATITASTYNGVKASCKVTVYNKPTSVSFSQKAISLGVGDSAKVSVKFNSTKVYSPCSFVSDKPDVATIDPNTGVITAHQEGTAKLTVTTLNGKSATCTVNVLPAPESIAASEDEITLGVGEGGKQVVGTYPAGTLCSFSYASTDESKLRVDAVSGALTALGTGSVDVIVSSHNGVTASCRVHVMEAPETLTLNKTTMKLMVGETNDSLTGVVNEGAASGIKLSSSNTRYVKVSSGKLVGVKAGTATITASTYNGVKASCKVTVCAAPKSVSFKTKSLLLGCGEMEETAIVYNPTSAYSVCVYSSSNPEVATVDPITGRITAVAPGTAVITATPQKGTAGTCTVEVRPAPDSVSLPQDSYALSVGMSLTLTPMLPEGTAGKCSFESSATDVVQVDAKGAMKGLKAGEATVTVTSFNGHTASCSVTVTPTPEAIRFESSKLTMLKGDTIQIPEPVAYDANGEPCPSTFSYSSSSTRYATVSGNRVKGIKTGTITITAKSYNGKTASFKLTIAASATGLALVPATAVLYTNGSDYVDVLQLGLSMTGSMLANVKYSSSNPEIASVTQEGLVTPVAAGTAVITASMVSGNTASATITVKRLSGSIALDCEKLELGEGESHQLLPQLEPDCEAVITFTSNNTKVVTVDNDGLLRAVSAGEASITASMQDGKHASVNVTVIPGPTAVSLKPQAVRLAVNESVQLDTQLSSDAESYCDRLQYSSSDASVVTIDETGTLSALGKGEASVTVRTCNGLTASCRVYVSDTADGAQLAFEKDHYGIICGDSAELPLLFTKAAIERGFTVVSSDPETLQVDGLRITAVPEHAGEVTVTLTVNPEAGAVDTEQSVGDADNALLQASCTVLVCEYAEIDLPSEILMKPNSETLLEYEVIPENLLGVSSFEVEDPNLISFDPETGVIRSNSTIGKTNLVFQSFNRSMNCAVTVERNAKYRALVVGSYNNSGASNDLPFTGNNMRIVSTALSQSNVDGERYEIAQYSNPNKSTLKSLVTGTFRDAEENDVSVIYIVTHGYYAATANGDYGYHFGLAPNYSKADPNTYVTANEMMNWMSGIKGNVVLILDSCRSGGFIVDCAGRISAAGKLSVLTAQTWDQNASFYHGTSTATTVEFLTYAFCRGLGMDQIEGKKDSLLADDDGDRMVTIAEAFTYAKNDCEYQIARKRSTFKETTKETWMTTLSCIKVPGIYKKSSFNAWYQSPQYMAATGMSDGDRASDVVLCAW